MGETQSAWREPIAVALPRMSGRRSQRSALFHVKPVPSGRAALVLRDRTLSSPGRDSEFSGVAQDRPSFQGVEAHSSAPGGAPRTPAIPLSSHLTQGELQRETDRHAGLDGICGVPPGRFHVKHADRRRRGRTGDPPLPIRPTHRQAAPLLVPRETRRRVLTPDGSSTLGST
ncbi:hypothetical protein MCAG_02870 [Micromonospora sp. ATCC 39149]|nr:hypothetical protein MCAG_02870 [Micromonospora sp. ATCC 39149]